MKNKSYIPPWWIVLSFLISFSSFAQNKIVGYEYFFNNATGLQYVPITPTSSFTLDRDIDVSSLTNTVNIFHLHFKDENGLWSSSLSKMFIMPPTIPASTDRKIVGYEYFFNDDGVGRQYFPISPTDSYNLIDDIDVSSLTQTVNIFHLRFKDSDGFWSPALSKMFITPPQILAGTDRKIVGYEYYFNNEGSARQYIGISESDSYSLITDIDINSLPNTVNTINLRFKDNTGYWSPVITKLFMIPPQIDTPVDRKIVGYEYFINDETNNRHYTAVSSQDTFTLLTDLDVNNLTHTVNTIHIRYKDNTGFWSPTLSKLFMIAPQPVTYSDTKITSYEYWFDYDRSNLKTIDVDPDVASLNIAELDMNHIWRGEHRIHTRYKDTRGEYSLVKTDTITKVSRPLALFNYDQDEICVNNDVSFTDNGSIDYDTYVWDFDDGTTSTDHDVIHTFTTAGTYDVTLTVTDTNTGVSNVTHQTISVNEYPVNTVTSSHTFPACYGETVILTADASDMGYLWSNGATTQSIEVTTAGSYSVQIWNLTGAGCGVTSDDIEVSFYDEIDNSVTSSHTFPACYGETVTLTANENGMNYLWSTGETTQSIDVTTAGNYSVEITNPTTNCVVNSDVIAVDFYGEIHNTITSSHTFPACYGEIITLTADESNMNYLWSNGATTQSIDVTTAGDYSVEITHPTTNCSVTSDIVTVSYNAEIHNTVTSSHTFPACYGETITLTADENGMNYLWSTGQTSQSIEVTTAGNYTVEITNPTTNCSVISDDINVSFNAEIDNSVTSSHTFPACFGETITLTANADGMYYLWSNGEVSQSITVTDAGNYSVQITNPSTNCVVNSDVIAVSFNAEIDNSITSSHTFPACFGETITLTANQNFANYVWSTGETTQSIEVTSAGNYSVEITDATTNCTVSSDEIAVSFNAEIDNSVSSSHTFPACYGETVTLTANQNGGTYLWSTGETTQSIDVTTAGNYSVEITNPSTNCSVTSDEIAVSYHSEIDTTITSSHTFPACYGETITLTAVAGMDYVWSTGENTQSIDVTTAGNYFVELINPTTGCRVVSDPIAVSFNAEIDNSVTSSHTMPACFGETITLTANQNFANYVWSTGETTQSIEVTSAGNYSVEITDATTNCSVTSDEIAVSFNAEIDNSVSSSHTFPACFGETITLTANQSGGSYLWSTGETTQSIDVTSAGNYSVEITNPSTNCSVTSDEIAVSYHSEIDTTITSSHTFPACFGETVTLTAVAGMDYVWSTGENTQSIDVTTAGNYFVELINPTSGCRVVSDPITVSFNAEIDNSVTSSHTFPACFGEEITLTANVVGMDYLWSNGATTQSITVNDAGNYSVQITHPTTNCVVNSDVINVSFYNEIDNSVDVSHSLPACFGETITLTANQTGVNYLWSNGATTQSIDVTTAGNYSVEITNPVTSCSVTSDEIAVSYHTEIDNHVTSSHTFPACFGETVTLTADESGMNYLWSNGATTQSIDVTVAGTYSVTISNPTGSGCEVVSDDINVSFNTEIDNSVTSSHTFPACFGETITLTANQTGVDYLWSNGATTQSIDVTTAGNYSVQLTNSTTGCSVTSDIIYVSYHTEIDNSVSSSHTFPACYGETITLTANATGMNYLWSTGETTQSIDVTTADSYAVSISNPIGESCTVISDVIDVSFNSEIDNSVTSSHTFPACFGETITLTANQNFANYLWSTGETTQSIEVTSAGNYSVEITDVATGCSVTSDNIAVRFNAEIDNSVSSSHTFPACSGETITLTANQNGGTYLWSTGETTQSIDVTSAGNYSVEITNPSTNCSVTSDEITVSYHSEIDTTITSSHTFPACYGETITLTANATGMNYIWSTGETTQSIDVTTAGNYFVELINPTTGCRVVSNPIAVSYHAQIDNTIVSSHIMPACFGETITLTANQSFANYLWSTGETTQSIEVTSAGNYSVEITDVATGCSVTSSDFTVSYNAEIDNSVSSSHTFPACYGETVTLTANQSGGAYLWSTGETTQSIDVTSAGNYSVEITNPATNCSITSDEIAVSYHSEIDTTITSSHTFPACYGETITLTANATGMNYIWSTGETTQSIDVTTDGNYFVELIDPITGCRVVSNSIAVSYHPEIDDSVTFNSIPTELVANQNGATYQWIDCNNNNQPIAGETGQHFVPTEIGYYAVIITMNGCSVTSSCIYITHVSVEENALADLINIYPNPVDDIIHFESEMNLQITIISLEGKVINKHLLERKNSTVNVSYLTTGMYILKIEVTSGKNKNKIYTTRFIKE